MSSGMKEVQVTGLISRIMNRYVITADDGTQYELSAIYPWQAVSADYGCGIFAENLGKRMTAMGLSDGHTIWKASLESAESNTGPDTKRQSPSGKRSGQAKSSSGKR